MTSTTPGINTPIGKHNHTLKFVCLGTAVLLLLAAPVQAQTTAPTTTQPAPAQSTPSPSAQPSGTQPSEPGIRAVNPATLRLTFYTVQPADLLVSNLMGLDVHNLQNEEIGEIQDIIVDNGKVIRSLIIGVGGFLGIGERNVAVDPGSIVITRETGGSLKAVANTTREDLRNAPEFKFEGNLARRK